MRDYYNKLVLRVDAYLRAKRAQPRSIFKLLPARLFTPELWLCERRSIAVGAAWGAALAIAPLPLQSFFALLACLRFRGNVPVGMLACWISIPGYQIIVWPLQWALGAWLMDTLLSLHSGASVALLEDMARHAHEGWAAFAERLSTIDAWLFMGEFALGCLLSCLVLGFAFSLAILLVWRSLPPKKE